MSSGSFLKIAVRRELISYEGANRFSPPNSHYFWTSGVKLSLAESTFCSSGRDRAPEKWMKPLASFLYGSKILGEAKRIQLRNPAEPGYPFGDSFELL